MAMSLQRIKKAAAAETKTHRKLFIIMQLLLGIGAALYTLECRLDNYNEFLGEWNESYSSPDFSPFFFIAAAGCALFVCVSLFKDMHNVQVADVTLSLPLSAKERYLSKLLSFCKIQIFPYIIWSAVTIFGACLGCGFRQNLVADAVPVTLNSLLAVLAALLFTAAIAIFCCCCSGTFAESVYFPIIIGGCITAAPYVFLYEVINHYAGFYYGDNKLLGKICGWWTYTGCLNSFSASGVMFYVRIAVNCLISLAVIFGSMFIYAKRDARSVGSPIVFRLMYELMMFLGVFSVFIALCFDATFVAIIISSVGYIIISVIVSRAKITFRSFMTWLLKYAASVALFVAIMCVGYFTDGFGFINYTPELEAGATSVEISVYNGEEDGFHLYNTYGTVGDTTTAHQKELIHTVRSLSKSGATKSFDEFIHDLFGSFYYSGSSFVEIDVIYDNDEYSETTFEQKIYVSGETAEKIAEELDGISYVKEYSDDSNYDYWDYGYWE
jgi:hypothetical protein